jgi:hypothetical protein
MGISGALCSEEHTRHPRHPLCKSRFFFGLLRSRLPTERRDVRYLIPFSLLVLATTLEAGGDAIIRVGLRPHPISARIALMLVGTVILYGYGLTLNLAPLDWGRLVGAYVATFFVVGQIINLVVFRTAPTLPIIVGGLFILTGGRSSPYGSVSAVCRISLPPRRPPAQLGSSDGRLLLSVLRSPTLANFAYRLPNDAGSSHLKIKTFGTIAER